MMAAASNACVPGRGWLTARIASDYAGLGTAARELFEEEFHSAADQAMRASLEQAAASAAQIAKTMPRRRTLPNGYYARAIYLLDLDQMLRAGLQIAAREMDRDEYRGLMAVRLGVIEFEATHPRCPSCGARNDRLAFCCRECGKEFKR